jgi:hypothetical protein
MSEDDERISLKTMIDAVEILPIISRLEVARRLVCRRGGDKESLGAEPSMVAAVEILEGVIRVLEVHPEAANLRHPEP